MRLDLLLALEMRVSASRASIFLHVKLLSSPLWIYIQVFYLFLKVSEEIAEHPLAAGFKKRITFATVASSAHCDWFHFVLASEIFICEKAGKERKK